MKILIVKTSSMGDVVHTLPALNDASEYLPKATFDWIVEPEYKDIPKLHNSINKVIEFPLREIRKNFFNYLLSGKLKKLIYAIEDKQYDVILDAQGLFKSGIITKIFKGKKIGLDFKSIREKIATIFYDEKIFVSKNEHAVIRNKELFAKALNYELPSGNSVINYGINKEKIIQAQMQNPLLKELKKPYAIFFHGTTWKTKHWPESYWFELAKIFKQKNINIFVSWTNKHQYEFVAKLANISDNVIVFPKTTISQMTGLIANSLGVIGVDTGFCHLAAALDKATISLFGATDPNKTAPLGKNQVCLSSKFSCAPCLKKNCNLLIKNNNYKSNHKLEKIDQYKLSTAEDNNLDKFALYPPCFEEITPKKVASSFFELIEQITLKD